MVLASVALYKSGKSPRIAYVRSADIVYGYLGMKEAQKAYEEKATQWQSNIDTLKRDYQRSVSKYTMEAAKMSAKEKAAAEKLLMQQEKSITNYSQSIQLKAKDEDQKMTQGVLNQVNSFVEKYAKEQGYDVVLGTTVSGSLLYGEKTMDITEEVLKVLNKEYSGGLTKSPNHD